MRHSVSINGQSFSGRIFGGRIFSGRVVFGAIAVLAAALMILPGCTGDESDAGTDGSEGTDGTDGTECVAGSTGCVCAENSACADPSDTCEANQCVPRTDCSGELACPCDAGSCNEGLTCESDLCVQSSALLVNLAGADARACDLMVTTSGRKVVDVSFPAGVRGRFKTRNERTALAVIRTTDTDLSGVVAGIVFDGDDAADGEIQSITATCYDRLGNPAAGLTATTR